MMKKLCPFLLCFALFSCAPLRLAPVQQRPPMDSLSSSAPAARSSASTNVPPAAPIEIPIEDTTEDASSSVATSTGALAERLIDHGILDIGMPQAPLTLTVFINYSSPYSQQFAREMQPRLEKDFVRNGSLKLEFVITPLNKYPNSVAEAQALLCAGALGKGQLMNDGLMLPGAHDRKSLLALAKKLVLPAKGFATCLDAKETQTLIVEQQQFIANNAVTGVPTFLIGKDRETGLPSYADLSGWIKEKIR